MNDLNLSGSGLEFPKGGGSMKPNNWCVLLSCGTCSSNGQSSCDAAGGTFCPGGGGICLAGTGGYTPP